MLEIEWSWVALSPGSTIFSMHARSGSLGTRIVCFLGGGGGINAEMWLSTDRIHVATQNSIHSGGMKVHT